MTTVYVSHILTSPDDGEPMAVELKVRLSEGGEIIAIEMRHPDDDGSGLYCDHPWTEVPTELMRQIDMRDLEEDALRALEARERGWP